MRFCNVLLLTAAATLSISEAGTHPTTNSIHSIDAGQNGKQERRFLRRHKTAEDELVKSDDEERASLNTAETSWLSKLASMSPAELNLLAKAPKNVDIEQTLAKLIATSEDGFNKLVKAGTKPEDLYKSYNIKIKQDTMTPEALLLDGDYQTYVRFKVYWDNLRRNENVA